MSQKLQDSSLRHPPNDALPIITCSENIFNGIKSCGLEFLQHQVKIGLCINCDRNQYCIWQENKKISCEHYQ